MKKMTENDQEIAQFRLPSGTDGVGNPPCANTSLDLDTTGLPSGTACLPNGTVPAQKNKVNIFNRNVRYLKIKDVERAYSKLIQDFCKGVVPNEDAKTLVYLLSNYLHLKKDVYLSNVGSK